MKGIIPVPLKTLTKWVTKAFLLKGSVLLTHDHDSGVVLYADGLTDQEIQDTLAVGIVLNRDDLATPVNDSES